MIGKIRLIVAIEDEIYLDKVCDYLETGHGRFMTERFSDKEAFAAALAAARSYDAVLYEPAMLDGGQEKAVDKIKIRLAEKDNLELQNGCYSVREYQKTDAIASTILKICSADIRFMGIDVRANEKAKLYMFTSPVGGAGVTTVALAAALHAAKMNRKVLYINLEQVPSINTLLPVNGITMTQVMRMAIENSPKLLTAVEGGRNMEPLSGLAYFGGFGDPTDFDSLKPEHMQNLATGLCALGLFDTIIVDAAWSTTLIAPLAACAEKIFLVSRNTNLSVERVNAFLRYAGEKELSYRNRLHIVLNALSGSRNTRLAISPAAAIPLYQMIIDTADFPAAALGAAAFSKSVAELARQF